MIVYLADYPPLNDDLNRLAEVYTSLGVEVRRHKVKDADAVFLRDVFGWTPFGLVRPAYMGKKSRCWEPAHFFTATVQRPWTWLTTGSFEGADLLFLSSREYILGLGARTTKESADQLVDRIANAGSNRHYETHMVAHVVELPDWHDQHVLGLMNVVRVPTGFVGFADENVLGLSWMNGWVALPHDEYEQKHSNWVQVGSHVVINERCEKTIQLIRDWCPEVEVMGVPIPNLVAHGGGVACSTGVIVP